MAKSYVTADKLREVLDYNPLTGDFTWRIRPKSTMSIGDIAGSPSGRYNKIFISGVGYWAHRLAWLHTNGFWPAGQIDHINRNGRDNRWVNLRDVSASANIRNSLRENSHGSGVTKNRGNTWRSQTTIGNTQVLLGNYLSPEAAESAFFQARALHPEGEAAMLRFAETARRNAAKQVASTKIRFHVAGELLGVSQAAKKLGIPERTMYYRLSTGIYSDRQTFDT